VAQLFFTGSLANKATPPPGFRWRLNRATRDPLADWNRKHSLRKIRENQKTKAGAALKPGSTGAFASKSSLPLHLPSTG
jgi:hypothetical protein